METVVAAIRALPALGVVQLDPSLANTPYYSGRDPVTGKFYEWTTVAQERVLDVFVLEQLKKDPRLEIRILTVHQQADKRIKDAETADEEAKVAEAKAKALRERADSLKAEALAAIDAIGEVPKPVEAPKPTPYLDQLMAALPDNVRETVDKQKLEMAVVRGQVFNTNVQSAIGYSAPQPDGAIAEARAQAVGKKSKKG